MGHSLLVFFCRETFRNFSYMLFYFDILAVSISLSVCDRPGICDPVCSITEYVHTYLIYALSVLDFVVF